jgi:hypothetical protein
VCRSPRADVRRSAFGADQKLILEIGCYTFRFCPQTTFDARNSTIRAGSLDRIFDVDRGMRRSASGSLICEIFLVLACVAVTALPPTARPRRNPEWRRGKSSNVAGLR